MKDPLVRRHPLHAMLTDLPIGATAVALVADLAALGSGAPRWRHAAETALGCALAAGGLAAAAGLWDYQAVPAEHPTRATGARHGWLNAGALALLGASLGFRGKSSPRRNAALSAAGFATMASAAWLGGEMVYGQGWRVVPAEHAEQLEQGLREDGQTDRIERAHRAVREYEEKHALVP